MPTEKSTKKLKIKVFLNWCRYIHVDLNIHEIWAIYVTYCNLLSFSDCCFSSALYWPLGALEYGLAGFRIRTHCFSCSALPVNFS